MPLCVISPFVLRVRCRVIKFNGRQLTGATTDHSHAFSTNELHFPRGNFMYHDYHNISTPYRLDLLSCRFPTQWISICT